MYSDTKEHHSRMKPFTGFGPAASVAAFLDSGCACAAAFFVGRQSLTAYGDCCSASLAAELSSMLFP